VRASVSVLFKKSWTQRKLNSTLHCAQNPTLGTIVASMHPAYLFKVWGRDGAFASMILDAAGYHDEAALFLQWMSQAEVGMAVLARL